MWDAVIFVVLPGLFVVWLDGPTLRGVFEVRPVVLTPPWWFVDGLALGAMIGSGLPALYWQWEAREDQSARRLLDVPPLGKHSADAWYWLTAFSMVHIVRYRRLMRAAGGPLTMADAFSTLNGAGVEGRRERVTP